MHETAQDLDWLQAMLDRSYEGAGAHLRGITTPERRIPATELGALLKGVQILDLATVTTDAKPRVAPVDGLFYRAHFYFSSSKTSVRYRHLRSNPNVSSAHTRGEELSVSVHGRRPDNIRKQHGDQSPFFGHGAVQLTPSCREASVGQN